MPTPPRRSTIWVGRVSLFVGATAISLATAEALLLCFPELVPAPIRMRIRTRTGMLQRPHVALGLAYRTDADEILVRPGEYQYRLQTRAIGEQTEAGFRDDGIDGRAWAVALGDSFTEGLGVAADECWTERLEASLGRDVVNLGVSGYSALQSLASLEHVALPLRPQVALYSIHVNDHRDNLRRLSDRVLTDWERGVLARAQEIAGGPPDLDHGPRGAWTVGATLSARDEHPAVQLIHAFEAEEAGAPPEVSAAELAIALNFDLPPGSGPRELCTVDIGSAELSLSITRRDELLVRIVHEGITEIRSGEALESGPGQRAVLSVDEHEVRLQVGSLRMQRRPRFDAGGPFVGSLSLRRGELAPSRLMVFDRALRPGEAECYLQQLSPSTSSPRGTILCQEHPRGWRFGVDRGGRLFLGWGARTLARSEPRITAGSRFQVAARVTESGEVSFFVDGRPAGSGSLERVADGVGNAGPLIIGGIPRQNAYAGRLADVVLFDRALDDDELRRWAGHGASSLDAPLAWWPLAADDAPLAPDRSGRGSPALMHRAFDLPSNPGSFGLGFHGTSWIEVPEESGHREGFVPRTRREGLLLLELLKLVRGHEDYAKLVVGQEEFHRLDGIHSPVSIRPDVCRSSLFDAQGVDNPIREGLAITLDCIARAATLCRAQGVQLAVICSPSKEYLYLDAIQRELPELLDADAEPGWTWQRIAEFCDARDIPVLSLGPAMREQTARGRVLSFDRDAHWNAAGHALVAEQIERFLREQVWLDD